MITVKEIAQMCNVSPSTVSNILNGKTNMAEETKNRVLKAIEETGYRPNFYAQGMRRQNNKTICIIAEELVQFSTPPIVKAIMDYAESRDYRTMLINMEMYDKWEKTGKSLGDEELLRKNAFPAFQEAEAMRADGVIYLAAHGRILDCVPKDYQIPVVFCYGVSKNNKYKSVVIDDKKSSFMAVDYLIKHNHRKIGVLSGLGDNLHTIKRLEGYKEALKANGITYDSSLVFYSQWERTGGYESAKKLIEKGVTAIWAMNDLMAAGAYDYIRECGMEVGKDISVMGFDNREISDYLIPTLSTSSIPLEAIGQKTIELMINEIEDEQFRKRPMEPILFECDLIERNSIGAIRQRD